MNKVVKWCFCKEDLCNGLAYKELQTPEPKEAPREQDGDLAEPTPVLEENYKQYRLRSSQPVSSE